MTPDRLAEQLSMTTSPHKNNLRLRFHVYQQPIRRYVTLPAVRIIPSQPMIEVLPLQGLAVDQTLQHNLQLLHILAFPLCLLNVFLELFLIAWDQGR